MQPETVSLNKKHQGKFARKVSKLKKKVEKGEVKITKQPAIADPKGLVYIKHLPHGFYEAELRKFFGQFGKVTKTRVCRSEKNGRSKGYGFIEFKDDDVAKIAAETMNNYLMFKKKLETKHIPVDQRPKRVFSGKAWKVNQVPRLLKVKKVNQERNLNVTKLMHLKRSKRQLDKINQKLKKLSALGIHHSIQALNDPTQPLVVETPEDIVEEENLKEKVKTLKKKLVGEKKKSEDKEQLLGENDKDVEDEQVIKKKTVKTGKKGVGAVRKMKNVADSNILAKKSEDQVKKKKVLMAKAILDNSDLVVKTKKISKKPKK